MLDIVFQALPILLMDYEKVQVILLPYPIAHEIGDKEPTKVAKRVNGSRGQLSEP